MLNDLINNKHIGFIMQLTRAQKKQLILHSHQLKPVVIIGDNGLTNAVIAEIETALTAHELIKIRINAGDREERRAIINTINEQTGADIIHRIGHVASFFRKNPKKKDTAKRLFGKR